MRISDWSSDVCSSDLVTAWTSVVGGRSNIGQFVSTTSSWPFLQRTVRVRIAASLQVVDQEPHAPVSQADRKRVVQGKSVSVRVDLGGGRIMKKKKHNKVIKPHRITRNETKRKK